MCRGGGCRSDWPAGSGQAAALEPDRVPPQAAASRLDHEPGRYEESHRGQREPA